MPIDSDDDLDISNALNIARQNVGGADEIQARIGGLNQFLSGLDLEANTPQFHTGMQQPQIGGAGITAYHGSPHDFEQFDTSKIGTGEGHQSYGHGLYFAEAEPTARHYQELLSGGNPTLSGRVKSVLADYGGDEDAAKGYIKQAIDYHKKEGNSGSLQFWQNALDQFDDLKDYNKGHMYEVHINAHPDHFLDWDELIDEQPPHVLEALDKTNWWPQIENHIYNSYYAATNNPQGRHIYNELLDDYTPQEISKLLQDVGIKGIKYLDSRSRAAGAGTRNYVVFDPNDIEIMRRYARGGDVRHGYATLGGVPLSEDEALDFDQNIVSGYDPMADAIQAKINSLTSNLNYEDVRHDPGLGGGKGLLPGLAANQSQQHVTRTGADILAKDPALAANPPIMSERGRPFHELEYTYVPKENLVPWKEITPEDLYRERALITPAVGDRSAANTLIQNIMGTELSKPVNTQGGGDFQRSEFAQSENPAAWASRDAAVKGMMTRIEKQNVPEDRPLYMSHTLMGLPASDSSHMMAQALLRQIEPNLGKITSKSADLVDNFLRNKIKDWPGIRNPEAVEKLLQERNVGADTALLAKALDKAKVAAGGFPDVGAARFAITDPRLFSPEQLATGYSMSKIDLSKQPFQLEDGHLTYPTKIPSVSGYEGGLKYQVPAEIMFQDWAKELPKKTKKGISPSPTQKQQSLMTQMPVQEANQQWLDNLMRHMEEHKKVWGYNEGGHIGDDEAIIHVLRLARKHFDDGGGAEGGGGDQSDGNQTDNTQPDQQQSQQQQQNQMGRTPDQGFFGQTDQQQQGQMGRTPDQGFTNLGAIIGPDASRMGFGLGVNTTPSADLGLTSTPSPQTISEYTQQRLDTPYQGTLQNAVMFPGNAFGMSYPGLVGKQNTAAGAAGFLGSLMGESGKTLDPSALNGPSIGIAQETGPRAAALKEALGINPSLTGNDLRDALAGTQLAQLGFALNEVNSGGYAPTARAMATGTNAADVADIVTQNFERPAEANLISSTPIREAYAQSIMSGKPSAATMPSGGYDATPASVLAALQSGVRMADTQRQNAPNQIASDAQLAGNTISDATNDPTVTAAMRTSQTAQTTTDPYAALMSLPGYGSEDPADIAAFNEAASKLLGTTVGPQSTIGVLATGQRGPDVMVPSQNPDGTITMQPHIGSVLADALSNVFAPAFVGVNDPNYAKMIEQKDVPFTSGPQNDHTGSGTATLGSAVPYIPPVSTAPVAVLAPQQTPYIPVAPAPYASLGANFVDPRIYQNPLFSQAVATGGTIRGNNAMGNALRIAGRNKS
jgi:Phage tail lysozyme